MGLAVSMMSDAAWRDILRAEEAPSFSRALECAFDIAQEMVPCVAGLMSGHHVLLDCNQVAYLL